MRDNRKMPRPDLDPDNQAIGSFGNPQSTENELTKREWVAPQLREFGHLFTITKGISYRPLDGISNLT